MKKVIIRSILLTLLLCISFAQPVLADTNVSDYDAFVTAGALNVRSGPGTGHSIIGSLTNGGKVRVTHHNGVWRRIVWRRGLAVYVHGAYIRKSENITPSGDSDIPDYYGTITASSLNVRSGPSTGYSIIGKKKQRETVRVTHHNGLWRRITWPGGTKAYVHGNFLVKIGNNLVRYNDIGRAACHNCYEEKYADTIADALDRVKSIEIDFWDQEFNSVGRESRHGDWYVRHNLRGGNDNNCGGSLRTCLQAVKQWSDNNRNADVVTVYLDKKQNWSEENEGRTPEDIDDLIEFIFHDRIYTPADLKGAFISARAAARGNAWKTREQLKGKLIFVLTGGKFKNHNQTQHPYIDQRRDNASMFVAVDLDEENDFIGTPEHFSNVTAGYLVFYNLKQDNFNQRWIDGIRARNYVTRMWWSGGNDTGRSLCGLLNDEIAHPAFYENWQRDGNIVVDLTDKNNICRRL